MADGGGNGKVGLAPSVVGGSEVEGVSFEAPTTGSDSVAVTS